MSNEELVNELKKDLVYNQYRDTYVIRGENLPFMAERLVKLFAIPDVSKSKMLLKMKITNLLKSLNRSCLKLLHNGRVLAFVAVARLQINDY